MTSMDEEITRMSAAGFEYINADQNNLHELVRGNRVGHRIVEARISSDGLGIWIKTMETMLHKDRAGTCRHSRQEQWVSVRNNETGEIISEVDKPETYTCVWLEQFQLPPAVARWASNYEIRSGDCESCQLYQPPDVPAIMKTKAA